MSEKSTHYSHDLIMPGCVLHVTGADFDVAAFLAQSELRPYSVHYRGEARRRGEPFENSGLRLDVSDADGKLVEEVVDAVRFLDMHESELRRLQGFPGVTDLRLDFGYWARDAIAQFDYLPPELITRAGNLGIGIELSRYQRSDECPAT